MNELIIMGIMAAIFAAMCAIAAIVEHAEEIFGWLDREITAYYAAKIVKRRVREIWQIRR